MITIEGLLFSLFVNRDDCYALQQHKGYIAKKESVTLELINQHLLGEITLGLYQLLKNMVKWGCLDFDKDTWEDFENAKLLFNYLVKQGLNPLFEMSGGGKYRCHIWVFSDTTASKMQEFLKNACNKTGIYPHEIFPKQNNLEEGKFGNLVKLPLGINRKTGKRSYFLDSNFNEIESEENIIKKLEEYL